MSRMLEILREMGGTFIQCLSWSNVTCFFIINYLFFVRTFHAHKFRKTKTD